MGCELCGKDGRLFRAHVEGGLYSVCAECKTYGTEVREVRRRPRTPRAPEPVLSVVDDAPRIIRSAREKKGMKQADFAKLLHIKESVLHAWETGHRIPTVDMAKRVEKLLHVSLLTQESAVSNSGYTPSSSGAGLTIGDMLSKK